MTRAPLLKKGSGTDWAFLDRGHADCGCGQPPLPPLPMRSEKLRLGPRRRDTSGGSPSRSGREVHVQGRKYRYEDRDGWYTFIGRGGTLTRWDDGEPCGGGVSVKQGQKPRLSGSLEEGGAGGSHKGHIPRHPRPSTPLGNWNPVACPHPGPGSKLGKVYAKKSSCAMRSGRRNRRAVV